MGLAAAVCIDPVLNRRYVSLTQFCFSMRVSDTGLSPRQTVASQ